jgi:hypothetical protein
MSNLTILGDTSGSVVLQAPAVSGSTTLTLPATTGTLAFNGPAFSAYKTATQAITQNAYTKVTYPNEEFDTNNNFASSTFTPTVAGYYQISTVVNFGGNATPTNAVIVLYKNGAFNKSLARCTATLVGELSSSILIYANGTTDYFEIYAQTSVASISLYGDASGGYTYFTGFLARGV